MKRIAIAGAGAMGSGIAAVTLLGKHEVYLYDVSRDALEKAKEQIGKTLQKSVEREIIDASERKNMLEDNLVLVEKISDLSEVELVIEAVIEDLKIKIDLFNELSKITSEDTILVSNTSTMSITEIAKATPRPNRIAGLHFFNPVPVMKLVEVIRGEETSDETVNKLEEYVSSINKQSVIVQKDTPGFIVNRIMLPQFREAIILLEKGIASVEDIDTAVKLGLNYPMGPFELMDYTGIEITLFSLDYMYEELKDEQWRAPQILRDIVDKGNLGRKTGKGWYDYS